MRAVIQRVGKINTGLCVFVGVEHGDQAVDAAFLAGKVVRARIFPDDAGKMNRDVNEVGGRVLAVSVHAAR
jgi:D-tyrosyl-tRNA(Tyr) deacylase